MPGRAARTGASAGMHCAHATAVRPWPCWANMPGRRWNGWTSVSRNWPSCCRRWASSVACRPKCWSGCRAWARSVRRSCSVNTCVPWARIARCSMRARCWWWATANWAWTWTGRAARSGWRTGARPIRRPGWWPPASSPATARTASPPWAATAATIPGRSSPHCSAPTNCTSGPTWTGCSRPIRGWCPRRCSWTASVTTRPANWPISAPRWCIRRPWRRRSSEVCRSSSATPSIPSTPVPGSPRSAMPAVRSRA